MGSDKKKLGLVRQGFKPRNKVWFGGLYKVKPGLVRRVMT